MIFLHTLPEQNIKFTEVVLKDSLIIYIMKTEPKTTGQKDIDSRQ